MRCGWVVEDCRRCEGAGWQDWAVSACDELQGQGQGREARAGPLWGSLPCGLAVLYVVGERVVKMISKSHVTFIDGKVLPTHFRERTILRVESG